MLRENKVHQSISDQVNSKKLKTMLQMGELNSWYYQDAYYLNLKKLKEIAQLSISKILLHWTIPLPRILNFLRNIALFPSYDKAPRLKLIQSAKNLCILTLFPSQENLIKRFKLRRKYILDHLERNNNNIFKKVITLYKIKTIERFYLHPNRYMPLYTRWFNFLQNECNVHTHYMAELTDKPILTKIENLYNFKIALDSEGFSLRG